MFRFYIPVLSCRYTIISFFFICNIDFICMSKPDNDSCPVLCSGPVLKTVQLSKIFDDNMHFVQMKQRNSSTVVLEQFDQLLNITNGNPNPTVVKKFVEEFFEPPGSDLAIAQVTDHKALPLTIDKVYDVKLKSWLLELNDIWLDLMRKTPEDVKNNTDLYSQIYLPNPFVIPGGRFREIYYWDTYWIVEGLLLSEMRTTAKGMIENLIHLVKKYGFVPNGSRKFYLDRSQPPLLIPMVDLYYSKTHDDDFLSGVIDTLRAEFDFWTKNRSLNYEFEGKNYTVYRYCSNSNEPRPESYSNDYEMFLRTNNRSTFFKDIRSACETGWDFSSRWFLKNGSRSDNILDVDTCDIIPVDLNSIMGYNAVLLSKFYGILDTQNSSTKYWKISQDMNHTISRLFWNSDQGFWFDLYLGQQTRPLDYYISGFLPLWSGLYGAEEQRDYVVDKVVNYIQRIGVTDFPAGIPSSLINSTQQMDFPNGYAPLQYFAVFGLKAAAPYNDTAGTIALDLARKWILNIYYIYSNNSVHAMYEKYDVTHFGSEGGGGFYPVQKGFGWTNGVALKFMDVFYDEILSEELDHSVTIGVSIALGICFIYAIVSYLLRMYLPCCHKEAPFTRRRPYEQVPLANTPDISEASATEFPEDLEDYVSDDENIKTFLSREKVNDQRSSEINSASEDFKDRIENSNSSERDDTNNVRNNTVVNIGNHTQ